MNPKDISTEEEIRRMQEWEPEPRETHADTTGDASTAWRRLDRRLVLLVKHSDGKWGLPIAEHRQVPSHAPPEPCASPGA